MTTTQHHDEITATEQLDAHRAVAATYFEAWRAGDFDRLAGVLADDVTFRGPLGTAAGRDECLAGLQGIAKTMTGIEVSHVFADDAEVLTWYDLHTEGTPPTPTVNWMHLESGRITRIRVLFDPRKMLKD